MFSQLDSWCPYHFLWWLITNDLGRKSNKIRSVFPGSSGFCNVSPLPRQHRQANGGSTLWNPLPTLIQLLRPLTALLSISFSLSESSILFFWKISPSHSLSHPNLANPNTLSPILWAELSVWSNCGLIWHHPPGPSKCPWNKPVCVL